MEQKDKKVYPEQGRRVFVAMSGGVDSSMAAALLKKQGYEVVGVFMRFWSEGKGEGAENLCCSEGAEKAARAVAAKLKIPFYVVNFKKEFKREVVDYFLREQAGGRTPNPCVVCNKKIKFGLMFEKAVGFGADYFATGHYARIKKDVILSPQGEESRANARANKLRDPSFVALTQDDNCLFKLFAAKDKTKDQTYFLYNLNQPRLSHILFPLGDYTKEEIYQLAKKWRLPYRKEESFDLCFVANDADNFVRRHLKLKAGRIMDYNNAPHPPLNLRGGEGELIKSLGQHQGLALFTIGQRKSIPVSRGPWWVVKKDEQRNILYVSNNEKDLYSNELVANQINWIGGEAPKLPMKVWAKIRYKSETAHAVIARSPEFTRLVEASAKRVEGRRGNPVDNSDGGYRSGLLPPLKRGRNDTVFVIFSNPQRAITSGQSAVFYSKSGEVLGGGVIK